MQQLIQQKVRRENQRNQMRSGEGTIHRTKSTLVKRNLPNMDPSLPVTTAVPSQPALLL
ncbi:MAG: hypothetical protein PUF51_07640 [Bifidobacteriaceae bacterium]|nr:hypothetical protein [Bifidobacteriaceae bacterium]